MGTVICEYCNREMANGVGAADTATRSMHIAKTGLNSAVLCADARKIDTLSPTDVDALARALAAAIVADFRRNPPVTDASPRGTNRNGDRESAA